MAKALVGDRLGGHGVKSPAGIRALTVIWGLAGRRSSVKLEQRRPGGVEQRRADLPGPGKSPAAPRHRRPSARGGGAGSRPSLAGARPVLKSMTETRPSSTSSRSTVPAITRPSGKVAASGASPSEPGPEQGANSRDRTGWRRPDRRSPRAALGIGDAGATARASASARSRRSASATVGNRSSRLWIRMPRRAASRIAALGGGAARVVDRDRRWRQRARRPLFERRRRQRPVGHGDGRRSLGALAAALPQRSAAPVDEARVAPLALVERLGAERWPAPARRCGASNWPAAGRTRPSSPSAEPR